METKVRVVEFSDRAHYQLQWTCPLSGRKKTKSSGVPRTGKKTDRDRAAKVAQQHEKALLEGEYVGNRITWEQFRDRYQNNKRACDDLDAIPEPLRSVVLELQSPGFLEFLEKVSGVEQIIPDPYLTGGGLHLSGPDGVLEPHSDFHLYPRLTLYRQINVLLYLNPE